MLLMQLSKGASIFLTLFEKVLGSLFSRSAKSLSFVSCLCFLTRYNIFLYRCFSQMYLCLLLASSWFFPNSVLHFLKTRFATWIWSLKGCFLCDLRGLFCLHLAFRNIDFITPLRICEKITAACWQSLKLVWQKTCNCAVISRPLSLERKSC